MGWCDLWNLPQGVEYDTYVGTWVNQIQNAWNEGYEHGKVGDEAPQSCAILMDIGNDLAQNHNGICPGDHVVYKKRGCNSFEIGRVLRRNNTDDGWFVFYSSGETAANTPDDCIFPIQNRSMLKMFTNLGGARMSYELEDNKDV